MANIKSAKKRIRVIEKKTATNKRIKLRLKDILKKFEAAVETGEKEDARELLATAEKKLMQAAAKGTLHKNTASRKISRLTKKFSNEFGLEALKEKPVASEAAKPVEKKAKPAKEAESEKTENEETKPEETEEKPKKMTKSTKKESAEEVDEKKED